MVRPPSISNIAGVNMTEREHKEGEQTCQRSILCGGGTEKEDDLCGSSFIPICFIAFLYNNVCNFKSAE